MTLILAIETSCDETAAALVQKDGNQLTVLANVVQSQISLHAKWGGVVPELAAREHIKNIAPVIAECLDRGGVTKEEVDAIAVTQGPGLMPALVVGVNAAKMVATLWGKPLIGIHHLEGHIYANLLRPECELMFPLLALVVSGGHTQLVLMENDFHYKILGETQDDAVGEAFDKVAKILGLPYPGGPEIAKRADAFAESATEKEKSELERLFPRPMADSPNFDFSFSGLKTAVLYYVQKHDGDTSDENFRAQVSYAFQCAATDVLVSKTKKALTKYGPKTLVVAGGVSANVSLRKKLENLVETEFSDTQFLMPEFIYSLDNAAMIGAAAAERYTRLTDEEKQNLYNTTVTLEPSAILPLSV